MCVPLTPTYSIISYGNIIFDVCLFDLCTLSQEYNYGIHQGLPELYLLAKSFKKSEVALKCKQR
jgi:hypothetical protein